MPSLAKGTISSEKSHGEAIRQTIDPHDQVVIDVLSHLVENGFIQSDASIANAGSVVLVTGRLFLLDRFILKLADPWFEQHIKDLKRAGRSGDVATFTLVKNVLKSLELPSHFLLRSADGNVFTGTIKEAGLEEPISAFYFKHGHAGLDNIHLIGIKEDSTGEVFLEGQSLMTVGREVAKAMSSLIMPPDSTKVMPLAIFRKITR